MGSRLKVPARLLKVTPIEARVAGFRGAVTVTAGGRTLPVSTGMMLKEGAVVATGSNAFLRLDLPDGTHLSLPSQSRVQLGRMTLVEMTGVVRRDLQVQGGPGQVRLQLPEVGIGLQLPQVVTTPGGKDIVLPAPGEKALQHCGEGVALLQLAGREGQTLGRPVELFMYDRLDKGPETVHHRSAQPRQLDRANLEDLVELDLPPAAGPL